MSFELVGTGDPEGEVNAGLGMRFTNRTTGTYWIKTSSSGNTGWIEIDAGLAADVIDNAADIATNVTNIATNVTDITALETIPDWTAPTLLNDWENYGSPFQVARYRKDLSGIVHIQGLVRFGTAANDTIFTLPSGYRPAATLILPSTSFAGAARIDIPVGGGVAAATGGSTTWQAINLSFASE